MLEEIVIDTNVLVAALCSPNGASRRVLRDVFQSKLRPVVSLALFNEYEGVLARDALMVRSPLSAAERSALFDAFLSCAREIEVYYAWRPNLRDEADNFVVEAAIAAGVVPIVTHNVRDFEGAQLKFPDFVIATPAQWQKRRHKEA